MLRELVVIGLLSSLDVGFLFRYFLQAVLNFAFESLVLIFLGRQDPLQFLNHNVLLVRLVLQRDYLVLQRLDCAGNLLGVAGTSH